jgi:hypothetical protein
MRERHVYPTSELCHVWAHDSSLDLRNSNGNVYSIGDTIYSYGSHFPMATKVIGRKDKFSSGVVFLINPNSYSSTTSSHQGAVRSACTGNGDVISLPVSLWPSVTWRTSGKNIREHFNHQIKIAMCDANNNRMGYWRRNNAVESAYALAEDYRKLHNLFAFRVRRELLAISPPDLSEVKARQDERDAIRNKRYEEQAKLWSETQKKLAAERELKEIELRSNVLQRMKAWREGKSVATDYFPPGELLRVKDKYVETTMHARVEVCDVIRFIRFDLPKVKSKLGLRHDVSCGPYHGAIATDSELIIGCHHFKWEEVSKLIIKLEKEDDH